MPTVSVVIPTYNRSQYILECIESVFDQSYRDFEILVIDDGSIDDTKIKLGPLIKKNQIRYFNNIHNNASTARNLGIKNSIGELIAFLDSDDLFYPDKLERQVHYFQQNPDAKIVHANFEKFDDLGNFLGVRNTIFFSGNIYPQILEHWDMLMATSSVMVRADVFSEAGLFDENLKYGEDLDMWARISKQYSFHHIPESLVKVRVHDDNQSKNKVKLAEMHLPYLQKALATDKRFGNVDVNRIYSKMFCYMGLNILIDGSKKDMHPARKLLLVSLKYRPWQIKSWGGYLFSFLNAPIRHLLGNLIRKLRDK